MARRDALARGGDPRAAGSGGDPWTCQPTPPDGQCRYLKTAVNRLLVASTLRMEPSARSQIRLKLARASVHGRATRHSRTGAFGDRRHEVRARTQRGDGRGCTAWGAETGRDRLHHWSPHDRARDSVRNFPRGQVLGRRLRAIDKAKPVIFRDGWIDGVYAPAAVLKSFKDICNASPA
jgi:hypothetical protein